MPTEYAVSDLLAVLEPTAVRGAPPSAVNGITADSRRVAPGNCFVAVTGFKEDGRRFIPDAVARGASLVVTDGPPLDLPVCQAQVASARVALARLAATWYGHPSRAMTVVGITGTNGKTTTSYLVEALLRERGMTTGVIGTVQYLVGGAPRPAGQTTPEALQLQNLLAEMRAQGVAGVAMEVSSHALALARVEGVDFDIAVFTNLTQDHLDFHGTFDAYGAAKRRLFELLAASPKRRRTAVVNADDASGGHMVAGLDLPVLSFGLGERARVRATRWTSTLDGIHMELDTPAGALGLASPLIGEHNVMNLLGAVAVGIALDLEPAAIARALGAVHAVPGRFEQVRAGQPFLVIVDYAHTPDALERVLTTGRKLTAGRLGVVFGCGGDRDRGKRPIMGELAGRLADRVWITSDNPRSERPEAIIEEIAEGLRRSTPRGGYAMVPERYQAIRAALEWARAGDTVIVAGKGHETYQILGPDVLHFDDREVARELLEGRRS